MLLALHVKGSEGAAGRCEKARALPQVDLHLNPNSTFQLVT